MLYFLVCQINCSPVVAYMKKDQNIFNCMSPKLIWFNRSENQPSFIKISLKLPQIDLVLFRLVTDKIKRIQSYLS